MLELVHDGLGLPIHLPILCARGQRPGPTMGLTAALHGNELNGITFNAVGSGTTVENVEVYSTYDDGYEFFGGAVNLTNAIALYVRDDSIDRTLKLTKLIDDLSKERKAKESGSSSSEEE